MCVHRTDREIWQRSAIGSLFPAGRSWGLPGSCRQGTRLGSRYLYHQPLPQTSSLRFNVGFEKSIAIDCYGEDELTLYVGIGAIS